MKYFSILFSLLILTLLSVNVTLGQDSEDADEDDQPAINSSLISELKFRGIGPALMSGRITEVAIDPVNRSTWYVAVASGGVFKTENSGTTWDPIFDNYGSYSVGTVAIDPNNRFVVWVGTGENNSQRSVAYGDGVYKSIDGGRSFKNVGLKNSEHIARILIDPRDSDIVYVASQGPLWNEGGERGLYKTTDGGDTWNLVLEIDEHTGVTDLVMDPRNPDILYAASYQRSRRVWTLVDGGPGSGVHKSTDGGATWRKINKGLPGGDKGRIGLAISPILPDVLYAIVEADGGGFYKSENQGENWSKQSSYVSGSPQYYQEIYADPHKFDRIYSLDTWTMVSEDGGKNFVGLGEEDKHVDNHAIVFDPEDPDHLLIGCDGGLYETWDRGQTYKYFANLPLTQFYRVAVSNDEPFYYVYGGTQDNNTQGGPSQTTNRNGIRNSDWFITVGGDGFETAVDPVDPNIVYSQSQYGGLSRFDRNTGEAISIKPQAEMGGPALRWNWDSALRISPHSNTRLYFGSQILFRSDDRGDTWQAISPDLTRNMDRNRLEIMDRVWGVDAVAKNNSTSLYGTIVRFAESPIQADLLYVGTDDGLIQISENGGNDWREIEKFGDVPEMTYVNDIEASVHDANTVYAVFNNHKMGDFKPYVMKSTNRGESWSSISGDLPERGSVYTIEQDHINGNLLFVGTEFGIFFTINGGEEWIQIKGGLPTIAVRELEIQRRENDVVAASFGRGFFVLDDYTPLRDLTEAMINKDAHIFPIEPAKLYIQDSPLGGSGKSSQGTDLYVAPNPPYGATFTYYLKESLQTEKQQRRSTDRKLAKEGDDVFYPSWDALKAEDREESPVVILTIRDEDGNVVRRVPGSTSKGIHRTTWDFRYPGFTPTSLNSDGRGPLVVPGNFSLTISKRIDGEETTLVGPAPFLVESLGMPSIPTADRDAVLAFQRQTGRLQRAVMGANAVAGEAANRISFIKRTIEVTPNLGNELRQEARQLEIRLMDIRERFNGDRTLPRRSEAAPPGILSRISNVVGGHWSSTHGPTSTHRRSYEIAAAEFSVVLDNLRTLVEVDLKTLEDKLETAGAPWTPGRPIPNWK